MWADIGTDANDAWTCTAAELPCIKHTVAQQADSCSDWLQGLSDRLAELPTLVRLLLMRALTRKQPGSAASDSPPRQPARSSAAGCSAGPEAGPSAETPENRGQQVKSGFTGSAGAAEADAAAPEVAKQTLIAGAGPTEAPVAGGEEAGEGAAATAVPDSGAWATVPRLGVLLRPETTLQQVLRTLCSSTAVPLVGRIPTCKVEVPLKAPACAFHRIILPVYLCTMYQS